LLENPVTEKLELKDEILEIRSIHNDYLSTFNELYGKYLFKGVFKNRNYW
jgi:hypothetical protein